MKVDTMRFVDRYAGIPLCFAARFIQKFFLKSSGTKRPQKILFIELSEMGSAIIVDPAMRKARDVFGAELYFLIFKKNKASLELLNTVDDDNIFTIDADNLVTLATDTLKFFKWARKRRIDTVVDLELFSRYTALLSAFSGADNIVGFHNFHGEGLYRGNMLTHKILYNCHQHMGKNFIAMINSLSELSSVVPYSKTVISDDELKLAKAVIVPKKQEKVKALIAKLYPDYSDKMPIVLINPNASELLPQRRWAQACYAELIKMISEKYPDVLMLITGAKSERAEAERLVAASGSKRCINFAGTLDLYELTALYSVSVLMVSNDSGPAHFASVTDMPTIVLFGPETPELYKSLGDTTPIYAHLACSPCVSAANHRKTPCSDNVCLQVITPEIVFEAVTARLGNEIVL